MKYKIITILLLLLVAGCSQDINNEITQNQAKEMLEQRILGSYNYNTHNGHDLKLMDIEKIDRWQDNGGSIFPAYKLTYEYSIDSQELPENVEKIQISAIIINTGIKDYSYTEIIQKNEVVNNEVHDFKTCVDEGYEVLEPDCEGCPKQCITPDERIFFEYPPKEPAKEDESSLCIDMCGDGECQEVVCTGEGCPCAENKNNCPEDC